MAEADRRVTMTEGEKPPLGKRFSLVYLNAGQPVADSERMRRRLMSLFDKVVHVNDRGEVGKRLEYELGISVTYAGDYGFVLLTEKLFLRSELRDILDMIGIVWGFLSRKADKRPADHWLSETRRIFQEENLGYYLDDHCAARHRVDDEFHLARAATIAVLGKSRYSAVLSYFDSAHGALDEMPPKYREAARYAFDSVEALFKLLCPRAVRLGGSELRQHLEPLIQKRYSGDPTAQSVAAKMISGFVDWIDGVHNYRHVQGEEATVEVPPELAVYILSTTAAQLRWLVDLDQYELLARK